VTEEEAHLLPVRLPLELLLALAQPEAVRAELRLPVTEGQWDAVLLEVEEGVMEGESVGETLVLVLGVVERELEALRVSVGDPEPVRETLGVLLVEGLFVTVVEELGQREEETQAVGVRETLGQ